jgi:hypothetical protein
MKVQLWAKKKGIKCGLIANISGTHIGNLGRCWEHHWEHGRNTKIQKNGTFKPPSPKEKKGVSSPPRHQKLEKTQVHMHILQPLKKPKTLKSGYA